MCNPCPNMAWLLILGFVLGLLALVTFALWATKKRVNLVGLAIGVDFLQIISMFSAFNFQWCVCLPVLMLWLFCSICAFRVGHWVVLLDARPRHAVWLFCRCLRVMRMDVLLAGVDTRFVSVNTRQAVLPEAAVQQRILFQLQHPTLRTRVLRESQLFAEGAAGSDAFATIIWNATRGLCRLSDAVVPSLRRAWLSATLPPHLECSGCSVWPFALWLCGSAGA